MSLLTTAWTILMFGQREQHDGLRTLAYKYWCKLATSILTHTREPHIILYEPVNYITDQRWIKHTSTDDVEYGILVMRLCQRLQSMLDWIMDCILWSEPHNQNAIFYTIHSSVSDPSPICNIVDRHDENNMCLCVC